MLSKKSSHGHASHSDYSAHSSYPGQYHGYSGVMFSPSSNSVPRGNHHGHHHTTAVVNNHNHHSHNPPPTTHHHPHQDGPISSGGFPRF
ncbi:hypothetical protein [Legionella jamestowniensis]|uniref:Uncharacterized protein n=1 Tax=Legionella jamestowniensis TaxID=455 RepID=A0A0W0UGG5_9GAMM|nr:hypothetical protein [Legionella jamestowniensis]KTD06922.1 hypothetical protein Ljam_1117 [Legionella jamestowniensis]SFL85071.1 hypothetical protein SAMN02746073_2251 [Legionella jamestowniensis DSM 19215]